jgi:hypothetical protein
MTASACIRLIVSMTSFMPTPPRMSVKISDGKREK